MRACMLAVTVAVGLLLVGSALGHSTPRSAVDCDGCWWAPFASESLGLNGHDVALKAYEAKGSLDGDCKVVSNDCVGDDDCLVDAIALFDNKGSTGLWYQTGPFASPLSNGGD